MAFHPAEREPERSWERLFANHERGLAAHREGISPDEMRRVVRAPAAADVEVGERELLRALHRVRRGHRVEPEEVMRILHEYHAAMGKLILDYEGTLEHFAGDGMMIFFNDPVPVENAAEQAARMALAMRERVKELTIKWRKLGHDLDFGVGLAQGYATIGAIGFEGRWEYGAIGSVPNLAARLCGEAKPGEILVSQRLLGSIESMVEAESMGELTLKGFHRPVPAYNILRFKG